MTTFAESLLGTTLADIERAARQIQDDIADTPLLRFAAATGGDVRLKAECLQPLGSFKIRAAANALAELPASDLARGVATASAGNFAQGLALAAKRRGVRLTVHAPDSAAATKLAAIEALGAVVLRHPFERWWQIMESRDTGQPDGFFIHPVCERAVVLGNATIGLELARQWPEVETVLVPFGGGGLVTGIALAFRALGRKVRVIACEVETAASLTAAWQAGEPVTIQRTPSFVDGIGSLRVLEPMWPLLRELLDDVVTVSVDECAAAVRALATGNRLIAEGAGAAAPAASLHAEFAGSKVAAIVSGGNIDMARLVGFLG